MRRPRPVGCLFVLAVLLVPIAPVLTAAGNTSALGFLLCFAAVQLSLSSVGALVATRLPRHRVGWLLLAIGLGLGLRQTVGAYGELGLTTPHGPLPADDLAAWLGDWTFVPIVGGGIIFLLHLFPDGHFTSRRWARVGLASAVVIGVLSVCEALKAGPLDSVETIDNPVGVGGRLADILDTLGAVTAALAVLAFLGAALGLSLRVRRSHGVERQQIKWIAFSLVTVVVLLAGSIAPAPFSWISLLLALVALTAMPVCAGVAILRYRLYDIDVVVNRALVYATLTITLAGAYLATVLVLQLALDGVTGDSSLAVAGSTLAVAAIFRPVRTRIQRTVDRRFFRHRYDAARTLEAFSTRLRDEVTLDRIGTEVLDVVAATMQPAHVSLWLREPERSG